ncbi:MAG: hypothetical protein J5635_03800 [Paludibacteraceae bacterium]|nr:hypothetical protein [Paludibacteraceae bacterium]
MVGRRAYILLLLLLACAGAFAAPRQYADSAVYQGINFKVDIGNALYQSIRTLGGTQQYEAAVNVNLMKRFYPVMELGYMRANDSAAGGNYRGQGAFTRIGLDLNPLRKNRNSDYFLTVGLRAGMSLQTYEQWGINLNDPYWQTPPYLMEDKARFDAWGEVVAGVQVKVAGGFHMGWAIRLHFLFTGNYGLFQPYYIPGFGCKDSNIFAFNYYLGWRW